MYYQIANIACSWSYYRSANNCICNSRIATMWYPINRNTIQNSAVAKYYLWIINDSLKKSIMLYWKLTAIMSVSLKLVWKKMGLVWWGIFSASRLSSHFLKKNPVMSVQHLVKLSDSIVYTFPSKILWITQTITWKVLISCNELNSYGRGYNSFWQKKWQKRKLNWQFIALFNWKEKVECSTFWIKIIVGYIVKLISLMGTEDSGEGGRNLHITWRD